MLDEEDDDTHFCCKCSSTISGLENYVQHRKNNCGAKSSRSITQVDHSYETFDFSENTSYPIKNEEVEKDNKCLSYTYELPYDLEADFFFSSLELQSSSKRVLPSTSTIPSTEKPSGYKTSSTKITETLLSTQENEDEWIESGNNSDNLIKAVNSISGHKKFDSNFKLPTFQHDSPEASDVEVDDDDEFEGPEPAVPAEHTGGKWKPQNEPQTERMQWDSPDRGDDKIGKVEEQEEFEHDLNPPAGHTKGKWVPGTKFSKISNKNQQKPPESPAVKSTIIPKKTTDSKKGKSSQKAEKYEKNEKQSKKCVPIKEEILPKGKDQPKSKRKISKSKIKCVTCAIYVKIRLFGAHLISRQHYRNKLQNPPRSFKIVLDNIHQIVKESPFQCKPCNFYANTEKYFLLHLNSLEHCATTEDAGAFWCDFCKFECKENEDMIMHLEKNDHRALIKNFNSNVPIIIHQWTLIECLKCKKEFRFNIQLKKHLCENPTAKEEQSKFQCKTCGKTLKSRLSLQRHQFKQHSEHVYYCSICEIEFNNNREKRKHNNSSVHKINYSITKKKGLPLRQCKICRLVCSHVLELKEHLNDKHPETESLCRFCGKGFNLPQDLTYHVRYKICQKPSTSNRKSSSEDLALKTLTRSEDILSMLQTEKTQKSIKEDPEKFHVEEDKSSPYKCIECKYSSKMKAELIFHLIMHSFPNIKPQEKIPCPGCKKEFSYKSLRSHLRHHTNEMPHECKICSQTFAVRQHLIQHTVRVHKKNSNNIDHRETPCFLCDTCGRAFRKIVDPRYPTPEEEKGNCPNCNRQTYRPTFFKCNYCPTRFVRKENFLEHLRHVHHRFEKEETPPTSYKEEEEYGEEEEKEDEKDEEEKKKEEEKEEEEEEELRKIKPSQNRKHHIIKDESSSQEESPAHSCKHDEDSESPVGRRKLRRSVRKTSSDSKKLTRDEVASDEDFSGNGNRSDEDFVWDGEEEESDEEDTTDNENEDEDATEEEIAVGEKDKTKKREKKNKYWHQCDMCGKVFHKRYNLLQHLTIHGERDEQFSCPRKKCNVRGRNAFDVKRHLEVHSSKKTHKCDFKGCNYRGRTARNLRRHVKIHSAKKEFKFFCSKCDFKTRLPSHLTRHMRIHTGENPFKCPHCDYACTSSENLRKHVLTTSVHPGLSLYECKLCDIKDVFETNIYKDYKKHLSSCHPEEDEGL